MILLDYIRENLVKAFIEDIKIEVMDESHLDKGVLEIEAEVTESGKPWLKENFMPMIKSDKHICRVLLFKGELIGFSIVCLEDMKKAVGQSIAIKKGFRGCGFGSYFMQEIGKLLLKQHKESVRTNMVISDSRPYLPHFYEKNGFKFGQVRENSRGPGLHSQDVTVNIPDAAEKLGIKLS